MPFLEISDARIHYALEGPASAPVLLFSNSLGADLSMWDPQAAALQKQFRILRYDTRGHGQSSVTPGPYTLEQLARDALHLLDGLHVDKVHFCGLSMGGMIGMWLGVNAPSRLQKLILCNTAAKIGTPEIWNARIDSVKKGGVKSITPAILERWFTPEFHAAHPETILKIQRMLEASPSEGYCSCSAAIRDMDQRETISGIRLPALVISGSKDASTTPADGQFIADKIPGARHVELPAAHLSNIEAAASFSGEVLRFLST